MIEDTAMDWEKIDFEATRRILEEIASHYQEGSPQYEAIVVATHALLFVCVGAMRTRFLRYVEQKKRPMNKHELEYYRYIMGEEADQMQ